MAITYQIEMATESGHFSGIADLNLPMALESMAREMKAPTTRIRLVRVIDRDHVETVIEAERADSEWKLKTAADVYGR